MAAVEVSRGSEALLPKCFQWRRASHPRRQRESANCRVIAICLHFEAIRASMLDDSPCVLHEQEAMLWQLITPTATSISSTHAVELSQEGRGGNEGGRNQGRRGEAKSEQLQPGREALSSFGRAELTWRETLRPGEASTFYAHTGNS